MNRLIPALFLLPLFAANSGLASSPMQTTFKLATSWIDCTNVPPGSTPHCVSATGIREVLKVDLIESQPGQFVGTGTFPFGAGNVESRLSIDVSQSATGGRRVTVLLEDNSNPFPTGRVTVFPDVNSPFPLMSLQGRASSPALDEDGLRHTVTYNVSIQ